MITVYLNEVFQASYPIKDGKIQDSGELGSILRCLIEGKIASGIHFIDLCHFDNVITWYIR